MSWKHKLSKRLSLLKDAAVLVGVLTACGDGSPTGTSDDADAARRARSRAVASVTVSSPADSLLVDSTMQFSVVLRDAYDRVVVDRPITWSSSDTTRATVSQTGLVRGRGPGAVTITATSEGRSGSDGVRVIAPVPPPPPAPAPVASVSVSPATASLQQGATLQLVVVVRDSSGRVLDRAVSFSSGAGGIASVSTTGLVTAVAAGLATITATSEGRTGSAAVTVTLPAPAPVASVTVSPAADTVNVGATVQLSATPRDANGQILTGRQVIWSTSNAAVATVSALGVVTGIAAGSASIMATSEGRSSSAAISVSAIPTPPPGFQVPDILDNASFETSWSSLTNWGGAAPTVTSPRTATRDSSRAYDGRVSARFSLPVTNGSDMGGQFGKILPVPTDRLWTRFWFYLDVAVDGTLKFNIYQAPGFGTHFGGVYFQAGNLSVWFGDSPTGFTNLRRLSTLTGGWHSLEVEYWRNGDPSGYPSMALWLDGQPVTSSLNTPPSPTRWANGRLVAGARTSSAQIGTEFLAGVLNGNPRNTLAGNLWIDGVSMSTRGRIGQ